MKTQNGLFTGKKIRKLVALVFLLLVLPAIVQAQFTYTTKNGTVTITGYTGSSSSITIPNSIGGRPVTAVGDWAFANSWITSVLIADGVSSIGTGAFLNCHSLTSVTIGNGVNTIGDFAFGECTRMTKVNCRGNPPRLGGGNVFTADTATVYFLSGAVGWNSLFGGLPAVLWNPTVSYTYTTNNNTITITGYTGSDGVVTIPIRINFLPVTSIGDIAFEGDLSLTNITIPNSVTSIGVAAFVYCFNLAGFTIPGNVTNIGIGAFDACLSLTNVEIPASVTSIGDYAFFYCTSLPAITVDPANPSYSSVNGVLFNKDRTVLVQFPSGKAGSYSIPSGVKRIGDGAFGINDHGDPSYDYAPICTGLTNLTVPGSVTNLGDHVFAYCASLISVTLSNGIGGIGNYAFFNCTNLTNINIPDSVTSIGANSFEHCTSLARVTGGNGLTSIEGAAFANCWYLANVSIPSGVTNIGQYAFYGSPLTSIVIPGGVTSIEDGVFSGCAFTNVTISDNVTSIGNGAFEYCADLTSVTIGTNVASIGGSAFSGCTSLTNIIIPDSTTNIGGVAFEDCINLATATIGSNVTTIGYSAFALCANLSSVFFRGDAPSDISYDTFYGDGLGITVPIENTYYYFIYYLPGSSGWGPTFLGLPTAPWLPVMSIGGYVPSGRTNQFGFNINWASGQTVVVEACTNLSNPVWQPLQTNMLTGGTAYFSDAQWKNYRGRFYRLRSP